MKLLVLVVVVLLCAVVTIDAKKLAEKYSWKELDYAWPSDAAKQEAIRTGSYVESHNLPLGLEVWKNKMFITVPRYDHYCCCC
jgi:hypothetical protein